MRLRIIFLNIKHIYDCHNFPRIYHLQVFPCLINGYLILLKCYPVKERHAFQSLFNRVKLPCQFRHGFLIHLHRGVPRFCKIFDNPFHTGHHLKLHILV